MTTRCWPAPHSSIASRRDVLGNLTSVVLAANTIQPCEVRSQFDHRGYALRSINPDGSRADRVYDERGRLVSDTITGSDGAQQSARTSYDVKGNLTRSVGPGGAATTYEYDGFGRLRLVTTPNNTQVHRTWGPGDVLARIEVHGADDTGAVRLLAQTDYAYDERRRRIRETVKSFDDDPAAAVDVTIETFYDTADRAVRIVDQRGAATSLAYDDLGRLVGTTDPMGNVVESDYDLVGNLLAVRRRDVDPGGGARSLPSGTNTTNATAARRPCCPKARAALSPTTTATCRCSRPIRSVCQQRSTTTPATYVSPNGTTPAGWRSAIAGTWTPWDGRSPTSIRKGRRRAMRSTDSAGG